MACADTDVFDCTRRLIQTYLSFVQNLQTHQMNMFYFCDSRGIEVISSETEFVSKNSKTNVNRLIQSDNSVWIYYISIIPLISTKNTHPFTLS